MFSINSNSMFTDFLPCARHDSRLRRSINEQKRQKSGKGGKEISVWETGSKNNSSKGIWRKKKKRTKFIRIPCWMVSISDLLVS